ncbi:unnamed protein product [Blepharisma stoltei]|uniref:C2 domain-containing protein n=1 Tax=Blepharisma stoltei TaxID=1481888 RepID=A0AAU9KKE1_9CILI|nr:unnamed protein product [Blepharisma stoltei]
MEQKQQFKLFIDILEFRNLIIGSLKDLPNPMIIVSFLSKSARTSLFPKKSSSIVMETLQMEKLMLSIDEFENEEIEIKAVHQVSLQRPLVIGTFRIKIKQVYLYLGHHLYNQWCALTNDAEINGYIRFSIAALRAGDELSFLPDKKDFVNEYDTNILGLPESAKSSIQLIVNIHRGELEMNRIQVESNTYITVSLAGTISKTKVARCTYSPEWKEKLLIPVPQPTMAHEIEIRIMITQRYANDLIIDKIAIPYMPLLAEPREHFWINIYEGEKKEIYSGRILVSIKIDEQNTDPIHQNLPAKIGVTPNIQTYIVWMEVLEIAGFGLNVPLKIQLELGKDKFESHWVEAQNQRWIWGKFGKFPEWFVDLPEDPAQLPKFIFKVIAKLDKHEKCIAVMAFNSEELVKTGAKPLKPAWKMFSNVQDKKNKNSKNNLVGSALFRLNMTAVGNVNYFRPDNFEINYKPFEVIAVALQAQGIKISDVGGLCDPFVTISINGVSKMTEIQYQCLNPQWNQIISWRIDLPENLTDCTLFQVDLWDWNEFPQENENEGVITLDPSSIKLAENFDEIPPIPSWHHLISTSEISKPKILMSFLLIPLRDKKQIIPIPSIEKILSFAACNLQILIIGTRKLQPYGLMPLKSPFVRVSASNSQASDTRIGFRQYDTKGSNHNYLEIINMKLNVLKDPEFSPCVVFKVLERATTSENLLGAISINLGKYLPWMSLGKYNYEEYAEPPKAFNMQKLKTYNQFDENSDENEEEEEVETREMDQTETDTDFILGEKLNYKIGDGVIHIDYDTVDLTFDEPEKKVYKENKQLWPGYEPPNPNRNVIEGTFEDNYGVKIPFETFQLKRLSDTGKLMITGYLRCIIRMTYDSNPDQKYLNSIIKRYKEVDTLTARFYVLSAKNLSIKDEKPPSSYVWLNSVEGIEDYRFDKRVFNENSDPLIMTCYSMKAKNPDEFYVNLSLYDKQEQRNDELIGYTEYDLEQRWFNTEYQEIKFKGLKEIPIETRDLYSGHTAMKQGEVQVWLELLTSKEAAENPEEILMQRSDTDFELRVIVWKLKDLRLKKCKNLCVKGYVEFEKDNEIEQVTDVHKDAKDTAVFNWRFKFRFKLPAFDSMLMIELYDAKKDKLLGTADIDLNDFYMEVQKSLGISSLPRTWINVYSTKDEELIGKIQLEASMLLAEDADMDPVGEGRSGPNKDPPLETPEAGRGFQEIENEIYSAEEDLKSLRKKFRIYIALFICIIICVTVPIVIVSAI